MTIEVFQKLNEMEKIVAILEHGRLLAQNAEKDHLTFLYRFEAFYISTKYNKADDQLIEINSFLEVKDNIPHHLKTLVSIDPASRSNSNGEN